MKYNHGSCFSYSFNLLGASVSLCNYLVLSSIFKLRLIVLLSNNRIMRSNHISNGQGHIFILHFDLVLPKSVPCTIFTFSQLSGASRREISKGASTKQIQIGHSQQISPGVNIKLLLLFSLLVPPQNSAIVSIPKALGTQL